EEYAFPAGITDSGSSGRTGCDQWRVQTRPVFTKSSWINRIRLCSLGLEISCAIERRIRRVQFKFALVPGTLKRYLPANRSVFITIASHASLPKSAPMIAG